MQRVLTRLSLTTPVEEASASPPGKALLLRALLPVVQREAGTGRACAGDLQ